MSRIHASPSPLFVALVVCGLCSQPVLADSTPQTLPFAQDWSNTGLITTSNNWSGVPGIIGYRGDSITGATGADPQTLLGEGTITENVSVNQGQTLLNNTTAAGGVAEFEITNPVIGMNGSGTADAPNIVIHLNTSGQQNINVSYLLRDLDSTTDNAVQPVALQYRIGATGNFTNVPAGFVADATTGPSAASLVSPVSASLPVAANDQPLVQVRIITANAGGNDEWVGIDDISVTGTPLEGAINLPIVATCPAGISVAAGEAGSANLQASDADSVVNAASITSGAQVGISLGSFSTAMADGETASVSLDVSGLAVGSYPVTITFSNNEAQSATCNVDVTVSGITPIFAIQGAGNSSPLVGQSVTTEGVVTKLNNNGFYLQDETGDGDGATSDGIFVFTSTAPTVSVGDKLRLTATVTEYNTGAASNATTLANPLTELTSVSGLTVLASGISIVPTPITFPEAVEGDLERYEGMLVEISAPLTASQNFFQGRYGQVTLSAEGRLIKPTNVYRAGTPEALDLADDNARRRIMLDDGTSVQNPDPTPYFAADNTLRAGDTLPDGLIGVIDYGLATNTTTGIADYRIHPAETVVFTRGNPRTAAPEAVGGNVRVASFNVLNYFTTIDQAGASCFPSGTRSDCRGADSADEFARQQAKIVAAMVAINADVVGLIEIENNGEVAANNLATALNAVMGAGTYASVGLPAGDTGSDAIRQAMIYKPAKLGLVGNAVSDTNPIHNRPPLAQTFAAANGEKFSVIVNHFKSKGSCPSSASDENADQGDGQGCWNALRLEQAQALRGFIANRQSSVGDDDVIVLGDLNAYGREAPITDFLDNGYVDQISRFNAQGYSYVFDGESGYLDHALSTPSLSAQIVSTGHWHINADEPSVIDYNLEFKQPACVTCGPDYYSNTAYRSSDHDPVVVGLNLVKQLNGTAGRDAITGTAGDDVIQGGFGADILSGGLGRDYFVYTSLRDATDSITDFQPSIDVLDLAALLQSLGIASAAPLTSGHVVCTTSGSHAVVAIDPDGAAGSAVRRPLVKLLNQACGSVMTPGNFAF
jgi:predicted extracellular nuclease